MNQYLSKENTIYHIYNEGKDVITIIGYQNGMAIRKKDTVEIGFLRFYLMLKLIAQQKKAGFKKLSGNPDPDFTKIIDLSSYQIPFSRYFENRETNTFWEVLLDNAQIHIRRGPIGGLGQAQSVLLDGLEQESALKDHYHKLIEQRMAQGYKEYKAGRSFSLKVVNQESQ